MTDSNNTNNINSFFIRTLSGLEDLLDVDKRFINDANIISVKTHIQQFLLSNCVHDVENDTIDIDCETTQQIIYCKKCLLNL